MEKDLVDYAYLSDEELYAEVIANECYKDVTREHVMKYV